MYQFKRDILLNVLNVQIATNSGQIICTDIKRVCGFAVSHIVMHYYAVHIAPSSLVCRSDCRSVSVSH